MDNSKRAKIDVSPIKIRDNQLERTKVQVVFHGIVVGGALDSVGEETQDGTNP